MATKGPIESLRGLADRLTKIDKEKLLRPNLGEESLEKELGPKLAKLTRDVTFALTYAPDVHDSAVQNLVSTLSTILSNLEAQSGRNNAEFVTNRVSFLSNYENQVEGMKSFWSNFVAAAVQARGFLEDEGIRQEYQRTLDQMKAESTAVMAHVQQETKKALEEAKQLAKDIEDRARRTAAKISVEDAQKQFAKAQEDYSKKVKYWGWLAAGAILAFLGVAWVMYTAKLPDSWQWHVIYYTAIRITVLTAVGATATFCLRVLRAQMHMSAQNSHRQRVANSMAAFVESAVTPEQRDLILTHLVDAVANFGSSGLLSREDDALYSQKLMVDSVTRTLTPQQK